MSTYKNSGSVTAVEVAYTDSLITHELQRTDLSTTVLPNCQVHQTSMYSIQFKASYDDVKDKNCCKYDNYWYRIVDYNQLSTGYGMVTCEFSPLLSFLLCDKTGMSGIAMSTITKNPMLATNVANYPTVDQIGLKQNDNIKLASSGIAETQTMSLYVAMSLPATLVNADLTEENTLSDWTSHSQINGSSTWFYQDTGVIILHAPIGSDGDVGIVTGHSVVDALTIIASDPLYVGCVVDAWIDKVNEGDNPNGPIVVFSSSSAYGLQGGMGASDSVQMYAIKRKPKILANFKIPKPDYTDSQTYNGVINITYNGETNSISLYDIDKKLTAGINIYDNHFVVMYYPSLSSEGGSFELGFLSNNVGQAFYVSLYNINIPVIGLQPGINAGAAYWQNNKTRYELGQELTVVETLYSAVVGAFTGAGAMLNAMSAGFIKFLTNKATKEAIITDNARLSTGASGGGHEIFNQYWSVDLQRTNDDDLDKYLYYNPFTCYKIWNISDSDAMSPIRLIDGNVSLETWVQGVFNIPNLPNGNKKQRVLSMLQQGVSVNYNVGIGYQEG